MDLLETLQLFRWTVVAALAAGLALPLVGSFLLLRRSGFHGVVLPQVATGGVALGYALLPWWIAEVGWFAEPLSRALEEPHAAAGLLLVCAGLATALCLLALQRGRRSATPESARLAGWLAGAWGATILLGSASPTGTEWIDGLLRGELLGLDVHDVEVLLGCLGVSAALLCWRWRARVLCCLDPRAAQVLGQGPARREAEFSLALGLATASSALIVGPLVSFALLVLPPLAAHARARSLAPFFLLSSAYGLASAALGLVLAFGADLPVGASLAAAGATLVLLSRAWPGRSKGLPAAPGGAGAAPARSS